MNDPTNETFREMLIEAQRERAAEARRSVDTLNEKVVTSEDKWDDEYLRGRIAGILAETIRDAGRRDNEELARAIAPQIVGTIRREIGNSHPEIIEALSPRIGDLIRAAIAKAMEDIQRQIDDAMPVDMWIANVKSRLTGAPSVGWLVETTDEFRVLEAYLVERGSGLLIARNLPPGVEEGDNDALDDDLLAAMIAALDAFVRDAFGGGGVEELRELTLTTGTVYLRASPTKILALRCSGKASSGVKEDIDQLLELAIRKAGQTGEEIDSVRFLETVGEAPEATGPSAAGMVGQAIAAIAAVLLLFVGHFWLESANRDRWTDAIRTTSADASLAGYSNVTIYDPAIDKVTVTGLAPDQEARDALMARLAALPPVIDYEVIMPVAGERLNR